MGNRKYTGPTIKLSRDFSTAQRVGTLNLHVVQGSTVNTDTQALFLEILVWGRHWTLYAPLMILTRGQDENHWHRKNI